MNINKITLLSLICCAVFFKNTHAQTGKDNTSEEAILKIYEAQLKESYSVRAMSDLEIAQYIAKGKAGIKTIEDFAKQLLTLYSPRVSKKTAVLFFVFNKDTLFRYFIVPGKIIDRKLILITKVKLEQLNVDIYNSLNIYSLAKNRSPKLRGIQPITKKSAPSITLAKAIENATAIFFA